MIEHDLINIFNETGLTRTIANPARIERDKKIDTAFDNRGNLRASAVPVRIPYPFRIAGALAVGANVAEELDILQNGVIPELRARVKTAPVGSEATFALEIDSVVVATVSIPAGTTSGTSPGLSIAVTAGQVARINVTRVGTTTPAEDATITVAVAPS